MPSLSPVATVAAATYNYLFWLLHWRVVRKTKAKRQQRQRQQITAPVVNAAVAHFMAKIRTKIRAKLYQSIDYERPAAERKCGTGNRAHTEAHSTFRNYPWIVCRCTRHCGLVRRRLFCVCSFFNFDRIVDAHCTLRLSQSIHFHRKIKMLGVISGVSIYFF